MNKQLPIFLVLLLVVAIVVKKRFMVDKENETVQKIINEIEITQEGDKPIVQEVKPKVKLKEKHVEKVQQKAAKTNKIMEQDLSREEGEYDDGKKERETEHKSGKEDGIYSLLYENGQKQGKAKKGRVESTTKVDITTDVDKALELIERGFYLTNDNTALEHKEGGYIEVSKRATNYFNKQK